MHLIRWERGVYIYTPWTAPPLTPPGSGLAHTPNYWQKPPPATSTSLTAAPSLSRDPRLGCSHTSIRWGISCSRKPPHSTTLPTWPTDDRFQVHLIFKSTSDQKRVSLNIKPPNSLLSSLKSCLIEGEVHNQFESNSHTEKYLGWQGTGLSNCADKGVRWRVWRREKGFW